MSNATGRWCGDGQQERLRRALGSRRASAGARYSPRSAHRERASHSRLALPVRGDGAGARAARHYRRSRRRGAPARNAGRQDAGSRARRSRFRHAAQRTGRAALHCANAQGRARGHAGHRQSRRSQRRAAGRGDARHHRRRSLRTPGRMARRAHQRSAGAEHWARNRRSDTSFFHSGRKYQQNRASWRPARHPRRRPAWPHDGHGRAHHGLSRARDGSRARMPGELCCGRNHRRPLGRCGRRAPPGRGRRCGDAGDRADRRGCAPGSRASRAAAPRRRAHPHHPGQDAAKAVARRARFSGRPVSRGAQRSRSCEAAFPHWAATCF